MDRSPRLPEFTLKAVLCGLAFGVLFGASNAYLGLKAGLTVSTSIPIAVISVAVFRLVSKDGGSILEANMAQTIGSASSSLASGTIFTIPALFMWGVAPPVVQIALLAFAGGVLGILAMVPLRRLLIVQADGELPYPEGRACAEVLQNTGAGSTGGRWIFLGLALGALIKIPLGGLHLLPEEVAVELGALPNARLALSIAPALMAVGYIVGFRSSAVMVSGSLVSTLLLYPLITKAHAGGGGAQLTAGAVKSGYITYIGAGAIAAAAFVTIARTGPTMVRSLAAVVKGLKRTERGAEPERTDRDLPSWMLVAGVALIVLGLALVPGIFAGDLSPGGRVLAALGVALFAFLFVPVSSRLVGLIGVSSNPTSAMALITLAGTASVFLALGWTDLLARAAVLTVGTVVCVAASKAGDISQDLKTGWLVKATPALQQYGQLLAAAVACWVVALVVAAMGNSEPGFGEGEGSIAAPQARLMRTMIEAVLGGTLPWDLLLMGGALAGVGALLALPPLSFALGIYLPLATMAAIFAGGCVRHWAEARAASTGAKGASGGSGAGVAQSGILCASGFVAGEGLAGVAIAGYTYWKDKGRYIAPRASLGEQLASLALFVVVVAVLYRAGRGPRAGRAVG